MTSALLRIGRPFWMVTSLMDDPEGQKKLAEYIRAAGVIRRLKTARIAIAGHAFEGMTDLMVDQLSLRQFVGPVCWPVEPEKVSVAMVELDASESQPVDEIGTSQIQSGHGSRLSSNNPAAWRWHLKK